MKYCNWWNLFLQIEFKSNSNNFAALLTVFTFASFGIYMGLNNLMKKVHISDKFDGVDINSTIRYGEFLIWMH